MASQQLDDLIQSLVREGRTESSGRFTMDASKAELKLGAFQLASPSYYVLKLVQAAVASGCKYVQVFLGRNLVTVLAPLRAATPFDLTRVLDQAGRLFPDGDSVPVRHLVLGLRAAQAVHPAEIRLLLFDSGEAWIHRSGGPPQFVPLPAEQRFSVGIGMDHGFAVQLAWPRRLWGCYNSMGELRALGERCAYAPVEVLVDQRPVNAPDQWFSWGPCDLRTQPLRGPFSGLAVASRVSLGPPLPIGPRGSVYACRACVILPRGRSGNMVDLTPVWDGVALGSLSVAGHGACRGSSALVCAGSHGLAADLSEFQVVRNEAFDNMLLELWQA